LLFPGANGRKCGRDSGLGVDIVDVFVPPHVVRGSVGIAADHIEYVFIGRVDSKRAGVVPKR
jgi:hypothetical protein